MSGRPWTARNIGKLKSLRQEGKRSHEIAEAMGMTPQAVRNKLCRLGLGLGHRPPDIWTPEKLKKLRTGWNEGKTSVQIGRELHISACAVMGKVRRLDLARRRKSPDRRPEPVVEAESDYQDDSPNARIAPTLPTVEWLTHKLVIEAGQRAA